MWERRVPAMPGPEQTHLRVRGARALGQDVSRPDPASGAGCREGAEETPAADLRALGLLPVSLSVGSLPAGVRGGAVPVVVDAETHAAPHSRKQSTYSWGGGRECQVLEPIVPASGLRDPGGRPGTVPILPPPQEKTQPCKHRNNHRRAVPPQPKS